MTILPPTEKQGGPVEKGDWQKDMARRRYQKGSIRKRGKRNPVWELQWWEDYIKEDGSIGRRRQSATLGAVSEMTLREARKLADERLRPVNQGTMVPQSTMEFPVFVERYFDPTFLSNTETIYTEALPPNSKHAPLTCLWKVSSLRHRNHRPATICFAENGKRSRVGICQPPPQSDVEDIRDGKEVEFLSGKQSRNWGIAPRKKAGPRKARSSGKPDSASLGTAQRARPNDGAPGHI